jgi:hypothetical protein
LSSPARYASASKALAWASAAASAADFGSSYALRIVAARMRAPDK